MMLRSMVMIPLLLVSGCSITPIRNADAICDGTRKARADLAQALVADGGDQSVMAGQVLLSQLQGACL